MANADMYVTRKSLIATVSAALLALAEERDWTAADLLERANQEIQSERQAALESRRWERRDKVEDSTDTALFV